MNLAMGARWIPVLRADGTRDWVAPTELGAPDIVAFDAPRADFNGALAQFAIGLLQTVAPVPSMLAWRSRRVYHPSARPSDSPERDD